MIGGHATTNLLGTAAVVGAGIDFTQDAGGRLHAAWSKYQLCGARRYYLLYRRNEPRGFGPPVVYPLPLGIDPRNLTVAPTEGGSSWMVFNACCGNNSPSFATAARDAAARQPHRLATDRALTPRDRPDPLRLHRARRALVHQLLVSGRRRGVRIVSVRFSFDGGQLARTDRRAPYRVVYTLGFAAGTRHVAETPVTYRASGRTRDSAVGRAIVMCP